MLNVLLIVSLLILFALVIRPKAADAVEFLSSDTVTVEAGKTTDGSLFARGRTVDVRGTVDGDFFCMGQNITVTGTVNGDVICVGQIISVSGKVLGSVRVAGQNVTVSADVTRNVMAVGQKLDLVNARINGEVQAAGESFSQSGFIGRSLSAAAQSAFINGDVYGNARLVTDSLAVERDASISGDLTYVSAKEAVISSDATVSGIVLRQEPSKEAGKPEVGRSTFMYVRSGWSTLVSIVFWTLLGLLLISIFPRFFARTNQVFTKSPARAIGMGIGAFFVVPFLLLVLALTIIGIPLSIFLAFVWVLILVFVRVPVAVFLGSWILETLKVRWGKLTALSALVGVPVLLIIFRVPFIGWLLSLFVMFIGTGAVIVSLEPALKKSGRH